MLVVYWLHLEWKGGLKYNIGFIKEAFSLKKSPLCYCRQCTTIQSSLLLKNYKCFTSYFVAKSEFCLSKEAEIPRDTKNYDYRETV